MIIYFDRKAFKPKKGVYSFGESMVIKKIDVIYEVIEDKVKAANVLLKGKNNPKSKLTLKKVLLSEKALDIDEINSCLADMRLYGRF